MTGSSASRYAAKPGFLFRRGRVVAYRWPYTAPGRNGRWLPGEGANELERIAVAANCCAPSTEEMLKRMEEEGKPGRYQVTENDVLRRGWLIAWRWPSDKRERWHPGPLATNRERDIVHENKWVETAEEMAALLTSVEQEPRPSTEEM